MRRYEDIDLLSSSLGTEAFMEHGKIPKGESPDVTGKRCSVYSRLATVSTYLIDIENNYHVSESHFDICVGDIDKSL